MIKKCLLIIIFIIGMTGQALAAFPIPSGVYTISNLDKACQKALEENKPLTFLYSDQDTTCPLCTTASNDILYTLDKMSIIVYVTQSDWCAVPPLVQNAIISPAAGKYIPKTVIVNPQIDKIVYIIPYQRQNRIILINEAKDKISESFPTRATRRNLNP